MVSLCPELGFLPPPPCPQAAPAASLQTNAGGVAQAAPRQPQPQQQQGWARASPALCPAPSGLTAAGGLTEAFACLEGCLSDVTLSMGPFQGARQPQLAAAPDGEEAAADGAMPRPPPRQLQLQLQPQEAALQGAPAGQPGSCVGSAAGPSKQQLAQAALAAAAAGGPYELPAGWAAAPAGAEGPYFSLSLGGTELADEMASCGDPSEWLQPLVSGFGFEAGAAAAGGDSTPAGQPAPETPAKTAPLACRRSSRLASGAAAQAVPRQRSVQLQQVGLGPAAWGCLTCNAAMLHRSLKSFARCPRRWMAPPTAPVPQPPAGAGAR